MQNLNIHEKFNVLHASHLHVKNMKDINMDIMLFLRMDSSFNYHIKKFKVVITVCMSNHNSETL